MAHSASDWTINADPTLSEIRTFLSRAEREAGGEFKLTIGSPEAQPTFWIMHHFKPTAYAFKDTKEVCQGTIQFCIQELGRFVSAYEKPYTQEQVAATLGVALGPFDRAAKIDGIEDLEAAAAKFAALAGPDMEPHFREGWQDRIFSVTHNPFSQSVPENRHAWEQGWAAADRHVNA